MRVAAVDIGTNSVLLLVAEHTPESGLRPLEERATITRLGQGVDASQTLSPAAVTRTNECLAGYAAIVRAARVERVGVVGTSAMRDAQGGRVVVDRVRELFGEPPRVLSGDEEARLTFRGALSGITVEPTSEVVVFDIGGGSTEVICGGRGGEESFSYLRSFDVGSVRLTERLSPGDPPDPRELEIIRLAIREIFASGAPLPKAAEPIGVAGTMTTLAAVSMGLREYDPARIHGHVMSRSELDEVVKRLTSLPLAARRQCPGLDPKRADVIVAGGVLALEVLDQLGASAVRISDRGVRWGLAEELSR